MHKCLTAGRVFQSTQSKWWHLRFSRKDGQHRALRLEAGQMLSRKSCAERDPGEVLKTWNTRSQKLPPTPAAAWRGSGCLSVERRLVLGVGQVSASLLVWELQPLHKLCSLTPAFIKDGKCFLFTENSLKSFNKWKNSSICGIPTFSYPSF
jgi:hypothetical protein